MARLEFYFDFTMHFESALYGIKKSLYLYQYGETNVMHFLFNLLRIKGIYMFRALLAHPQEALHKRHLVYRARVTSVCCTL
jgi:hypothetical protein